MFKHILETGIRLYHAFVVNRNQGRQQIKNLSLMSYDQYLIRHSTPQCESVRQEMRAVGHGH